MSEILRCQTGHTGYLVRCSMPAAASTRRVPGTLVVHTGFKQRAAESAASGNKGSADVFPPFIQHSSGNHRKYNRCVHKHKTEKNCLFLNIQNYFAIFKTISHYFESISSLCRYTLERISLFKTLFRDFREK